MKTRRPGVLVSLFALAAFGCSSEDSGSSEPADTEVTDTTPSPEVAPTDTSPAGEAEETVERVKTGCGTGGWPLPDDLATLSWHGGQTTSDLTEQSWEITVDGTAYGLAAGPAWEGVRFDLPHPAEVHGFTIRWANAPDVPDAELSAGLYRDFGHNGFDFWPSDPLWSGTRCVGEADSAGGLTYVFENPIAVAHPGLVYVAQYRPDATSPAFVFTDSPAEDCEVWGDCHSSVNLPAAATDLYDIGVSLQLPHDFVVSLHLRWTDQLAPEDLLFQKVDGVTTGRRVAFGDYDGDGDDDLLAGGGRLYRNDGADGFTDVSDTAGLEGLGVHGGVWGDYDNDGCLDLFTWAEAYGRGDRLLHNGCDGTFADVTELAGIADLQSYNDCQLGADGAHAPTAAAAWFDGDGDGLLDLYLANFICWTNYTYYVDTIFWNAGDGTFVEGTAQGGLSPVRAASRGVFPIDHDQDGDIDLFVNRYVLQPNALFDNLGGRQFVDVALAQHIAGHLFTDSGGLPRYGHSSGAAWGDLDGDGDFDAVVANLAHPRFYTFSDRTEVLLRGDDGVFTDLNEGWLEPTRGPAGLRFQETHSVPVLADFDRDGALDLVITCVYDGRPTDFYWGRGDGTFELDSYTTGIDTKNGWGIATADIDLDGDVDVGAGSLFENTGSRPMGRWLSVAVLGDRGANRAGIGTVVRVEAGDRIFVRQVSGGNGQGCQDSAYLHFGLGDSATIDAITLRFPGHRSPVRFNGPFEADQRLWLTESGQVHRGWSPPSP